MQHGRFKMATEVFFLENPIYNLSFNFLNFSDGRIVLNGKLHINYSYFIVLNFLLNTILPSERVRKFKERSYMGFSTKNISVIILYLSFWIFLNTPSAGTLRSWCQIFDSRWRIKDGGSNMTDIISKKSTDFYET